MTRRVLVVGFGNPDAADDAVGILAVREARVALEAIPGVRVIEGSSGAELIELLSDADAAVVVDAVRTPGGGRPPGTLVRAEAGSGGLPAEVGVPLSSHGFGAAEAVALAAALGSVPPVVFLGVEVADVRVGHPMTAPVRGCVPGLVRSVLEETAGLAERA
ncbi:MAG TPA: hydrogenase maturation protease [Actinomycetota bacterium]|nr:hydrogenase maturation protease [Actinomycetota bacterium]